ncbi:MAG: TldD/PmbA family protein [Actinomycetota bacterium]|nr:TldD/PmbA family protein [Actinomycetota bacterium]
MDEFEILKFGIEHSRKLGVTSAEAAYEFERGVSIKVCSGKIEKFEYSLSRGLSIRVLKGNCGGRAYTTDFGMDSVRRASERALEATSVSAPDEHQMICPAEFFPPGASKGKFLGEELAICSGEIDEISEDEKIEFALSLERMAKEFDGRISGVESANYSDSVLDVILMNSNGFKAGYKSSFHYGYLTAIAEERGESQTGFGFTAGRSFASLDPSAAAREASEKAILMLKSKQPESCRVPVLFDNVSSCEIVAVLGAALSAKSVILGRSFLRGRLGEKVASELVNITDDGRLHGGFGTAPFDAEGAKTGETKVFQSGILTSYLHNCYTSSRMGTKTTGNACRASYRSSVEVSPTNLKLRAGKESPDELRSGIGKGFEVIELQGVHVGFDTVSGDVSVGARGRWIEEGKPSYGVREVTIAGTMQEVLGGIKGLGNDPREIPVMGGICSPSILVEGLVLSGK